MELPCASPRKTMVKGTIKREIFRIRTPVLETRHAAYFLPALIHTLS